MKKGIAILSIVCIILLSTTGCSLLNKTSVGGFGKQVDLSFGGGILVETKDIGKWD